jgi:tetratricopeptide (TPR) repeat protein
MLLVFVVHLLIVTANQGNALDTLRKDGRDALLDARYADAERLLKAALTEVGRSEGIDNTQRANVMNDLAEAYRYLDRFGEAESLYKQSIALLRKEPQSARALVIVLNNFGGLLKIKQQFARAPSTTRTR